MMSLATIRRALDEINNHPIDSPAAQKIWTLEEAWSHYNSTYLGEMRAVIDDRMHLAHSKRVRAGF